MSVSEGLLRRLGRLNPTTVFLGALVFVLVALFVPGVVGGVLLLILLLVLGVLAIHGSRQTPAAKGGGPVGLGGGSIRRGGPVGLGSGSINVLRLAALTLVLALALSKLF